MQVGDQELTVGLGSRIRLGACNPVGMDHLCFVVNATSLDDVVAGLRQRRESLS